MAKRFIDTNIFKKCYVRSLKAADKLLWIYLFTDCNHAGIWEIDLDIASIYCDQKVTIEKLQKFIPKVKFIDSGKKLFIPSFIEFQYGQLMDTNNTHKSVIRELQRYNLLNENLEIINNQIIEGFVRGSLAPLDKDKDKDKDKDILKRKHFFKNSPYYDYEIFKNKIESKYLKYDLEYYHDSARSWAQSKEPMYLDWLAVIRNMILRDIKENKAKLKTIHLNSDQSIQEKAAKIEALVKKIN